MSVEAKNEEQLIPLRCIPPVYQAAQLRNVTPVDRLYREMGVGLNLPGGTVARYRLSVEDVRHLIGGLSDYLQKYDAGIAPYRLDSQSSMSSGIPSVDGSVPQEGKNV